MGIRVVLREDRNRVESPVLFADMGIVSWGVGDPPTHEQWLAVSQAVVL